MRKRSIIAALAVIALGGTYVALSRFQKNVASSPTYVPPSLLPLTLETKTGFTPINTRDWVTKADKPMTYSFNIPEDWKAEYANGVASTLSTHCLTAVRLHPPENIGRSITEILLFHQSQKERLPDYHYDYIAHYRIDGKNVTLFISIISPIGQEDDFPLRFTSEFFTPAVGHGFVIETNWGTTIPDSQTLNILAHILASIKVYDGFSTHRDVQNGPTECEYGSRSQGSLNYGSQSLVFSSAVKARLEIETQIVHHSAKSLVLDYPHLQLLTSSLRLNRKLFFL